MLRLSISECGLLKKDNQNEKDHCNNSGIIQHFECVECSKTRSNSKSRKNKTERKSICNSGISTDCCRQTTPIAASGMSCLHQIFDGTNRKSMHPVTILRDCLK